MAEKEAAPNGQAIPPDAGGPVAQPSAVGDLASLTAGQVLLPSFILRRADGLYVDISALDSLELFPRFAERVFAAGARFDKLDYDLFINLTFDYTLDDIKALLERCEKARRKHEFLLARDIVPFPEERRGIYRGAKVLGKGEEAEYLFEQVSVDDIVEVPRYGEPDENGECPLLGVEKQTVPRRLYPDFDEFVAALWDKGVRYGIDAAAVRAAIDADKVERVVIAHQKPPVQGKDASVAEQTELLHRDDTPRILPNGRMDLRHFKNRFPQVTEGTRLFKKLPRTAGVPGWNVSGQTLEPNAVKDFDINTLGGLGTRIERSPQGDEYVVAAKDGFLNIDTKSNQISVLDKIINREGVSIRTTGDLSLAGDEFEEHGEVQEKRLVEGHNMSFFADVFGRIVSDGGRIVLKQGIAGGAAHSPGGAIVVEGTASRATLDARGGSLELAQAESCLLIGGSVRLKRAVRCEIVADTVEIEIAEGCAIAAKQVKIGQAKSRKEEDTAVALLLPDLAHYAAERERLDKLRQTAEEAAARKRAEMDKLAAQAEMKTYFTLQARLDAKELTMTETQQANWQVLLTRLGPMLRQYADIDGQMQAKLAEAAEYAQQIVALDEERAAALADLRCEIARVEGETGVRTLRIAHDAPPLADLSPKELHLKLRAAGLPNERLFSGAGGSFSWTPPG